MRIDYEIKTEQRDHFPPQFPFIHPELLPQDLGPFSKVFLVQKTNTGEVFAMKCIRKDIILENDQMENIQLEKDILYSINHPFLVNMEYVF